MNPNQSAIVRFTKADLSSLVQLAQDTWLESLSAGLGQSDIAAAMKNRDEDHFLAALEQDEIWLYKKGEDLAGFIQFGASAIEGSTERSVEIRKLYVASQFQRVGVGRALMLFALDQPTLNGRDVYLDVWSENQRALSLYQSLGFEIVSKHVFIGEFGPADSPDYVMCKRGV